MRGFASSRAPEGATMPEQHEYAERMFPAPVDLGIAAARPRGVQRQVRHELVPRGRGRRGQDVVRGRWHARARRPSQSIVVYPPTRRAADAGRPVRAGEDRRARRHGPRPAARRLDRPDDPRDRGRAERRRVGPSARSRSSRADARGLAARELPEGDRRLQVARRAGLRRDPRADDLRQLPHAAAASPTRSACR